MVALVYLTTVSTFFIAVNSIKSFVACWNYEQNMTHLLILSNIYEARYLYSRLLYCSRVCSTPFATKYIRLKPICLWEYITQSASKHSLYTIYVLAFYIRYWDKVIKNRNHLNVKRITWVAPLYIFTFYWNETTRNTHALRHKCNLKICWPARIRT